MANLGKSPQFKENHVLSEMMLKKKELAMIISNILKCLLGAGSDMYYCLLTS